MTLVLQRPQAGPQTHAFLMGVGAYPHLLNADPQLPLDLKALDQLPSAPRSAIAVGRWLSESYRNPVAPLGSVELLLSDPTLPPNAAAHYPGVGGQPIGVGVLVDRTRGRTDFGLPFFACLTLDFPAYDPADCPLCARQIALTVT